MIDWSFRSARCDKLISTKCLLQDHTYGNKEFESLYPKWGDFCHIRENLDPNGMFLNANLERVFGKGIASVNLLNKN